MNEQLLINKMFLFDLGSDYSLLLLLYHDFILLHAQLTFTVFLTDLRSDVSHPLVQLADDGG